jgi:hypothetical protein
MSDLFLDQLALDDFAAERKFLSPRLAAMVSPEDWQATRLAVIAVAGKTRRYAVHGTTFYQDATLLAAIDFSGPAERPDTLICGFLLWELTDGNQIGLLRLEQNAVQLDLFRHMPVETAAQTMADWRCPVDLIESSLGVRLQ